jgi:hypothetical protein
MYAIISIALISVDDVLFLHNDDDDDKLQSPKSERCFLQQCRT